jgi:REP element-mobilizing transposase RayT
MHGLRLRRGRISAKQHVYLLTAVTFNRERLFIDWATGRTLVNAFKAAEDSGEAKSLAWVVMPDHFHWLVKLQDCSLGGLMRNVKSKSALDLNRQREAVGPVWQRGYHDRGLRREEDLKAAARYVIANPVRAGLVERVGDYPLWDAVWV